MARTKRNAMNIAEAREKIRTTQLINRLTNHVLGKVKMEQSQVSAALGLLKKSLPDLSASEVTGNINHNYVARMPETSQSAEEWQNQHTPTTH